MAFSLDVYPSIPKLRLIWICGILITIFVLLTFLLLPMLSCSVIHGLFLIGIDITVGKIKGFLTIGPLGYCLYMSNIKTCFKFSNLFHPVDSDNVEIFDQVEKASVFIVFSFLLNSLALLGAIAAIALASFPAARTASGNFACFASTSILLAGVSCGVFLSINVNKGIPCRLNTITSFAIVISALLLAVFASIKLFVERKPGKGRKERSTGRTMKPLPGPAAMEEVFEEEMKKPRKGHALAEVEYRQDDEASSREGGKSSLHSKEEIETLPYRDYQRRECL